MKEFLLMPACALFISCISAGPLYDKPRGNPDLEKRFPVRAFTITVIDKRGEMDGSDLKIPFYEIPSSDTATESPPLGENLEPAFRRLFQDRTVPGEDDVTIEVAIVRGDIYYSNGHLINRYYAMSELAVAFIDRKSRKVLDSKNGSSWGFRAGTGVSAGELTGMLHSTIEKSFIGALQKINMPGYDAHRK